MLDVIQKKNRNTKGKINPVINRMGVMATCVMFIQFATRLKIHLEKLK